jgi:mitochondrial fission protein ELM1
VTPNTWVIVSDKTGDNGQVEALVEKLGWPVTTKHVYMLPQWVKGKPRVRPTLDHLDLSRSDPLTGPWPDLIITIGRRTSMVALWVREQSGGHSRIVLVGKPSGPLEEYDLVITSAENQMPPLPNVVHTTLPFMRISAGTVASEAARWAPRLAALPPPLIAILVGGETNPFVMNQRTAAELVTLARRVVNEQGGTPWVTTSRRTPPEVVAILQRDLPPEARFFAWHADATDNPYRALLGSADGFMVTADSISMMVEVIRLHKPLAILPLPVERFRGIDLWRRSFATWLFRPRCTTRGDRWRHRLARLVHRLDVFRLLSPTRDFRAFHRLLVELGLAVWAGQPLRPPPAELPDDLATAAARVRALFPVG